jgi:hypothetical protein
LIDLSASKFIEKLIIQDPVFFDRGRYYFTGVWNQASQDIPHQQTILTAHPSGLSSNTNLTLTELIAALKILERHDAAAYDQEKWRISIAPLAPKAIELFRRWVIDRLYAPQS